MGREVLEHLRSGRLSGIRRLNLSCGLKRVPREVLALADTLEVLDLSGNELSELPEELTQLTRLRVIFCSNNRFTRVPDVLGRCPSLEMVGFKANRISELPPAALPPALRWLILTDNRLEELPPELGDCHRLQKLMLAGNDLKALPLSIARCRQLELVRIAANSLAEFPWQLLQLPRLSWLAYAGNPFATALEERASAGATMPGIEWNRLKIEALLGSGASGTIYRARYLENAADGGLPVAVKLFKGAVTSDGLPEREMAAALHAGRHPQLVPLRGQVRAHPDGVQGLVMDLIDPSFRNLADPPSLESCTRDVYGRPLGLDWAARLRLAEGMASAIAHMHQRGILHGDFYAHNIVHDNSGNSFIGDFGAACFFSLSDRSLAEQLQQIEMRAYGCLIEELFGHDADLHDHGPSPALAGLRALQAACSDDDPARRPMPDQVVDTLRALSSGGSDS